MDKVLLSEQLFDFEFIHCQHSKEKYTLVAQGRQAGRNVQPTRRAPVCEDDVIRPGGRAVLVSSLLLP